MKTVLPTKTVVQFSGHGILPVVLLVAIFSSPKLNEACQCGKAVVDKIIRGQPVTRGLYPWMAALVPNDDHYFVQCGATLITRRFALTAYHCVDDEPDKHRLLLGMNDLKQKGPEIHAARIKRFIKYNPEDHHLDEDIALIEIARPVRLGRHIQPICLPAFNEDFGGTEAVVAGYGETNPDYEASGLSKYSNILLAGVVDVTNTKNCNQVMARYKRPVAHGVICAGSYQGQPDHCYGDSGGPLMHYDSKEGSWVLIGIVSAAYKCAEPKDYSFYVNVSYYRNWIDSHSDYRDCPIK